MKDIVFKQDPQLGSETFILKERTLAIVGGVGLSKERIIRLTDISPDYEQVERLFHRSYLVPLFFAVLFGAVSWRLFTRADSMVAAIIAGIAAFLAPVCLFLMEFTPVEIARFRDTRGQLLFEVYRPRKASFTYDEFVCALVKAATGSEEESATAPGG